MEKINGLVLAEMIDLGSKNLAKNAEKINALNVFPVPDGDTGTNYEPFDVIRCKRNSCKCC